MNPSLASLICACGIAGLFYLDREHTTGTSKALWIPILWVAIVGSRAVSEWFGITPTGPNAQLEGSPVDAAVFGLLELAAFGVLIFRRKRVRALIAANWPILIYFAYCLISVIWSSHTDVALKRWIKALGDVAIVLIIVTEPRPGVAIRRLISRVGFVLLPASVLLIKYYGDLGRGFTASGVPTNTGVTTNKNSLGVMLLVISLGTLWEVIRLLRAKRSPDRRRHLVAQVTLLIFGICLLEMANSQTSIACFILGGGMIILTGMRAVMRRPARVHALCLSIVLVGGLVLLLGGSTDVVHAMGRKSSLSGRTDIWAALLPTAVNPIIGAGFESYWISPNAAKFANTLALEGWYHPGVLNEAHSGYIEVYMELGWVGVVLISLVLITGYKRAIAAYRCNPSIGGLMLAYIIAAAVYSITEAGFRMMDCIWVFLLLAIVSSSAVVTGVFGSEAPTASAFRNRTRKRDAPDLPLDVPSEPIYGAFQPQTPAEVAAVSNLRDRKFSSSII